MENFKSGFISIIGRTNVGKSTLLNLLAGNKIAAIANKPQTTRTAIKAIVTNKDFQAIFIDTPGIHKPKTALSEIMVETAFGVISDVDIIIFVIEATSNEIGKGDMLILEKLKEANKKAILVINKIDLIKKENLLNLIDIYNKEYKFDAVVPISALKSKGINDLLNEIQNLLPNGPKYYDEEEYTDQTIRQIASEIIREKLLNYLDEEIPHGVYVEIEKMKKSRTKLNENIYNIESVIYCNKDSHKGIIIGKNGEMLKKIGKSSRIELERIIGMKINLKIWVKVDKGWQDNKKLVEKYKNK